MQSCSTSAWGAILAGSLFLTVPAAKSEEPAPPPEPRWDYIEFQTKSWGQPVTSWRLTSTGMGSWTETRRQPSDPLGTYTLVWHEIPEDAAHYIAVERIFAELPIPAPDPDDCENILSDQAYGTLRLTKGATTWEIAWDSGCFDDDYQAFLDILKQADTRIAEAGRAAPVLRIEEFP